MGHEKCEIFSNFRNIQIVWPFCMSIGRALHEVGLNKQKKILMHSGQI